MASDLSEKPLYRRYTTRFDVVARWPELRRLFADKPFVLDPTDAPFATSEATLEHDWVRLDQIEPGWRDRLRMAAAALAERLPAVVKTPALADTALTLLVDQSGSMRGERIRYAAAALDIVQAALTGAGVKVEVLGFTTRFWRGGQSRWWWGGLGRKRAPGRLNDLLHIVYREADAPAAGETPEVFREMLRPELLKENVDGEALEWALGRLRAQPEARRILLVISDGAPVDDSTLYENHESILADHLREVIAAVRAAGDVELAGFGIDFAVGEFYERSWSVEKPVEIGDGLLAAVERVLLAASD